MFKLPKVYSVDGMHIHFDMDEFSTPLNIDDGEVSVFHRNYDWRDPETHNVRKANHYMEDGAVDKLWQSTFSVSFEDGRCDPNHLALAVRSLLSTCGYHGRFVEAVKVIQHPEPVEGCDNLAIQLFIGS
jgi:hypothetical protein